MFAVFTGKMKINNKGFLDHGSNEVFFDTREKAVKSAERRIKAMEADEKTLEYTVWVVEYGDNGLECSERDIIGQVQLSSQELHQKYREVKARLF